MDWRVEIIHGFWQLFAICGLLALMAYRIDDEAASPEARSFGPGPCQLSWFRVLRLKSIHSPGASSIKSCLGEYNLSRLSIIEQTA